MPCTKPCTSTSAPLIIPTIRQNGNGVLVEDDDSSTSSTVTVNHNKAVRICISKEGKSACCKKKSVCFDEDRNISYSNTQMCSEECKRLWCSAQEFLRFKEGTSGLARQVARFEEMDTSQHSYRRVMERTYEACCQSMNDPSNDNSSPVNILTAGGEKALKQWIDSATTRLGLEKRAVRLIAHDRSARRKNITKKVLRIQDACNASSSTTPECKAELLRAASQAISRPSRLFAEVMAGALSAVVDASSCVGGNIN